MTATPRRVLIVVENLPVPLDRRVWLEATTLTQAGYQVSVLCPTGRGWDKPREATVEGGYLVLLRAARGPFRGAGPWPRMGALWHRFRLARRILRCPWGQGAIPLRLFTRSGAVS